MFPKALRCKAIRLVPAVLLAALVASGAMPASAAPIGPGFDLFHTVPFMAELPVLGTVPLMGAPIGPGNTDTIVERMGATSADGTIPIELVALSLMSSEPVNVGGSFFDVFVTINKLGLPGLMQPDTLQPSLGAITITMHDDAKGGGTFDSFFDVFADVTLEPLNGGNPFHTPAPVLHLDNMGATWSHTPPPDYPSTPEFPSGDFYPGPIAHMGMHPVVPSTPEPSTVLLLGGGLAALAARQRKPTQEPDSQDVSNV